MNAEPGAGLRGVRMRDLVRQSKWYFALLTAAAVALRLFFVLKLPVIAGDSLYYGELAKNWLQQGILGIREAGGIVPSLVRLPGYPAFLAAIWAVTGVEHYRAVLLAQVLFDVATCFLVADLARRTLHSARAARVAFALAALCPFTANYVACALAETLAIFFAALALDLAVTALDSGLLRHWAACGAAVAAGILLRPDGGILLAAIGGYAAVTTALHARRKVAVLAVLGGVALAPLAPWAWRNWRDFHVFQPLAPRYANAPGQFVPMGFERWVKTWMVDYVSVAEFYWVEGDENFDIGKLPARAFDSEEERRRTEMLLDTYNNGPHVITADLDRQFGELAQERIWRHPARFYLALPALRIADMWLRPRTEMLGIDDRWWSFDDQPGDSIAVALGLLNLLYVGVALWGAVGRRSPYWVLLLAFVVVRSLFLGTLENPEPRYTLECFPVVMVLASAALARGRDAGTAAKQALEAARVAHESRRAGASGGLHNC